MGLRDRLRNRLSGLLGGPAPVAPTARPAAPAPSPSPPPPVASPAPSPPVASPAPPPSRAPTASATPESPPSPGPPRPQAPEAPTERPAAEALAPTHALPAPPEVEASPVEPRLPDAADAAAPTEAVARNADAPNRDAHLRPTFYTTAAAIPVHVVNTELGLDLHFTVEPGEFVLEAADRAGFELPSSCRNGGCLTCTGKLLDGKAEITEDQYVLEDEHLAAGFRLLCCTQVYAPSTFLSHQEDEVK